MTQPTQGEWGYLKDSVGNFVVHQKDGMQKPIANIWHHKDAEANAQLIAAAKDMQEALETCQSDWADGCYGTLSEQRYDAGKVKAALSKSRGETA